MCVEHPKQDKIRSGKFNSIVREVLTMLILNP